MELIVGGGDHSLQTGEVCNHSFRHRTLHSQCTAGQSKPSSWKDEPAQKALLSTTLMCGMSEVPKIICCLAAHRHISWSLWGKLSWRKGLVSLSVHIYATGWCALLSVSWVGHLQQHSCMAQDSPDLSSLALTCVLCQAWQASLFPPVHSAARKGPVGLCARGGKAFAPLCQWCRGLFPHPQACTPEVAVLAFGFLFWIARL